MTNCCQKQKLLIVDDQPENSRVLMDALGDELQIIIAKDGNSALEKALIFLPDLVLLDVMTPGMDGFEICRKLKSAEQTKNIPIIFVTDSDDLRNEEKGLKLGAIDYIRKPFHLSVTVARIHNHLKLKRKSDMLEALARIDGLTEIHNRRGFDETLTLLWSAARRNRSALAMILIDIDFFKKYNDYYGHSRGDICLAHVARTIQCAIQRTQDFVARYGGEEFAVLLADTGLEGALIVAERLRRAVEELRIPHQDSPINSAVTISLGVASIVPPRQQADMTEQNLIRRADDALYQAKNAGRNRTAAAPV